jgi:hypothetical protein
MTLLLNARDAGAIAGCGNCSTWPPPSSVGMLLRACLMETNLRRPFCGAMCRPSQFGRLGPVRLHRGVANSGGGGGLGLPRERFSPLAHLCRSCTATSRQLLGVERTQRGRQALGQKSMGRIGRANVAHHFCSSAKRRWTPRLNIRARSASQPILVPKILQTILFGSCVSG